MLTAIDRRSIYGELPKGRVIFSACDSKYFMEYAGSFACSAVANGFNVHIHVVNPTEDVFSYAGMISTASDKKCTFTFHDMDFSCNPEDEQVLSYYASCRFLVAPHILRFAQQMLVLDIDGLIMKSFDFPQKAIGYFKREPLEGADEWLKKGSIIAAGAIFLDIRAQDICDSIVQQLTILPQRWFNDQVALYNVLRNLPESDVELFSVSMIDHQFNPESFVWTAKGNRKYKSQTYINQKTLWDEKIANIASVPIPRPFLFL